jgi:NADPH:quinone reductase-like Zn-dependent oxidoreductase
VGIDFLSAAGLISDIRESFLCKYTLSPFAMTLKPKPATILGQKPLVLLAVWQNLLSWFVRRFVPSLLPRLLPPCEVEDLDVANDPRASSSTNNVQTRCISIGRPGGVEQLRVITLKPGVVTCGYNVKGQSIPFSRPIFDDADIPPDCVVLNNEAFSVNYADCCIRWGLYESAHEYVGYPIVPGFDVAGRVERVGSQVKNLRVGDRVFGCTFFGAYSSRILIPAAQLRPIPSNLSTSQAASLPAVTLTALYALFLAGHFPTPSKFRHRGILIHSAAGGVGSMLVQLSKILGLSPIVGVVGSSSKVETAKALGCNVVIDKSREDLWEEARKAAPEGFSCVMDSNGIETIQQSYEHLAMTGRLIIYGFHTNLPMGKDMLSPIECTYGRRM